MKYKMQDIDKLLESPATKELLKLLEKYKDDPALLDSILIAVEMLLSTLPTSYSKEIRRFAFYDSSSEKSH